MRRALAFVAAVLLTAIAAAAPASAKTKWLCSPAKHGDPCDYPGDTVAIGVDGNRPFPALPKRQRVDCFYVYPTVSEQEGPNAKRIAEPAVRSIAQYQASRFNRQCREFAPLYRQATLKALTGGGFTPAVLDRAYADVRAAFREYLRTRNHGRGFVLIGHSQGTGMLRRLVADVVDPRPAVRKRLVSAILLGGNVTVRKGGVRGGDFKHVPLCSTTGQAGCIIAYSTFLDDPPADAIFGNVNGARSLNGKAPKPGTEVACVNPASITKNRIRPFTTITPSEPFGGPTLAAGIFALYGGPLPTADASWVIPADRYRGRCERINGAHVLKIAPIGDARHLNAIPAATWGLHLVDVNGALGQLETALEGQVKTYLAR